MGSTNAVTGTTQLNQENFIFPLTGNSYIET